MSLHPDIADVLAGESEGCVVEADCLNAMAAMPECSVESIVTDPPYGLSFMGKEWDHGVPGVPFWEGALRVAKPGAMLFAFGGTRTVHRLACAIEDAGWEIRDRMQWLYGTGFPKSHDISKAIDKAAGAEREVVGTTRGGVEAGGKYGDSHLCEADKYHDVTAPATEAAKLWDGWGTALKPAHEPIIVAMKPLDGTFAQNAQKWGVAGLWIDGGRIEGAVPQTTQGASSRVYGGGEGLCPNGNQPSQPHTAGRWPANIIHDGSAEVVGMFPQSKGQQGDVRGTEPSRTGGEGTNCYGEYGRVAQTKRGDEGSAARFFYCAKASKAEREKGLRGRLPCLKCGDVGSEAHSGKDGKPQKCHRNGHPTVKPLALMEYLCKLCATPTGGVVLDPFCGSGTTLVACKRLRRRFVGLDNDGESVATARARLGRSQRAQKGLFDG